MEIVKKTYFTFLRSSGTPHDIAMAVAIGFFVGCVIPIGLWGQTLVAILLALRFKTNPGLAYAATWISNPYSVFFMYPVFCFTGAKILGHDMTFVQIKQLFVGLLQNFNWENCVAFCSKVGPRLISAYAIGSLIYGLLLGGIGYYATYKLIQQYRIRKEKRHIKVRMSKKFRFSKKDR